jgi:hypothetical protein
MAENNQSASPRPPYSNRGVYPPIDITKSGDQKPKFDAYGATVFAHPKLILDHLEEALEEAGIRCHRADGGPVAYYKENMLLLDETGHRIVQVRSGGNPHPHVECKGSNAGVVAAALRKQFHHRPSRIDSAIDLVAPDLFDQLLTLARNFKRRYGIRLDIAGAEVEDLDRGTTIYLGSRQSQCFVRIYQKGLQLAELQGLSGDDIPDELRNLVRIELEFKPQKDKAKKIASVASATEVWGLSQWTADFAKEALSIEAERVNVSDRRESDHQRALRFMAQQYRSHLHQLLIDCKGDYEAAMATLVELADLLPAKAA